MTGDTAGDAGHGAPDELRLALVLNGGVSLAVWISGVVSEIDAGSLAPLVDRALRKRSHAAVEAPD